jgi:hypothetical protein
MFDRMHKQDPQYNTDEESIVAERDNVKTRTREGEKRARKRSRSPSMRDRGRSCSGGGPPVAVTPRSRASSNEESNDASGADSGGDDELASLESTLPRGPPSKKGGEKPLTAQTLAAHNVETVPRIFKRIRPAFRYDRSLDVITQGRNAGLITKSNLILGMGEERAEISEALRDLYAAGTDIISITQYLRPSSRHHPVERWVHPDEFVELKHEAEALGFLGVLSGPLVRSSYRAGRLYAQSMTARGHEIPEHLTHLTGESAGFSQAV